MGYRARNLSKIGQRRLIVGLGGLYIVFGVVRALLTVAEGKPLTGVLTDLILIGGPGILILYGGYRLPHTNLHPDVYPRIITWCLGGFGLLLGIVVLRVLDPSVTIDSPFESAVLATSLGSLASLAIGMYEGRALSRAREAEQHVRELREERNLRERIVKTSPIGIAVIDADGTVTFANEHLAEIIGLPQDEIVGLEYDTRMFEATDSNGDQIEKGVFDQVLSTGTSVYDADRMITRPDDQRICLSVNGAPLRDSSGDVTGVVFAAEDITERKEREAELTLFRRLVDHSNDAVFVIDPETGQFLDVNETACRRLEYDREELLENTVLDIETNLSGLEDWHAHVDDVRAENGLTFKGNHQRADGTIIPVEVNINYVALDREYMFAVARDVTERQERKQELEERNERLGSFASMLAHELRNPVTIGQIYSQQFPDNVDSEAVGYVTEAFDRIEDMIDVMLVLTRGREVVGECTPVNLGDVSWAAWDEVDTPEATLEVTIDQTIKADETYIRHLFRNLFENAVDHGGADVTITIGELPSGFYVADDGTGIPTTERDSVFEAGYTTASDNGGTGLGLAFVKELAEVYEWECSVAQSKDGGAQFEFRAVDELSE